MLDFTVIVISCDWAPATARPQRAVAGMGREQEDTRKNLAAPSGSHHCRRAPTRTTLWILMCLIRVRTVVYSDAVLDPPCETG
jgi:hypothetical protein